MSIFAISDLHLSLNCDKTMVVFPGWENYVDRIKENWFKNIKDDDTVIIAGDISWAKKISEAKEDFKTCKNFVKGLGWLMKFLLGKLKAGVVVD